MHLEPILPWQSPSGVQPVLQLPILRLPAMKNMYAEMSIMQLCCYAQIGMGSMITPRHSGMLGAAICMHRVLIGNINWSGRYGSLRCLTSGCCFCCAGRRCGVARARSKESGTAQQGRKAHHCLRWALGCRERKDCCTSCQRHAGRQGCWRASMYLIHPPRT